MILPEGAAHEQLMLALSHPRRDMAKGNDICIDLAARVSSWDDFADLCAFNATMPLVKANMDHTDGLAELVPAAVLSRFDEAASAVRIQNEARLEHVKALARAFANKGATLVLLKGVAFAEIVYANPCYKKMNDVDILIRKSDLDTAYDIYADQGFFSAAALAGGSPRAQERFSHHAPPFFSRDTNCVVGTHWGLHTPLAPYKLDMDAIWSRIREIDFHGTPAYTLAPMDNLHHLCVHLPYYKTGLRELADFYNLIERFGDDADWDWDLFRKDIFAAKSVDPVFHTLSLANRLSPNPHVQALLDNLSAAVTPWLRRDTDRQCADIAKLLRSRSVYQSEIEKAFAEFSLTTDASEKRSAFVRMWKGFLFPPEADVIQLAGLDEPTTAQLLGARIQTPRRLFELFAHDVGWPIALAVMAKTMVDTTTTSVRSAIGMARASETIEEKARSLGLTQEQFQKVKDALE